jgi:high-affinity K+ transport system ATPase subunit B
LKYFQEFFFRVFACANSSVNVDNIICLFISLLPSFVPALLCAVLP